jgi:hypothetical protein
MLNEIQIDIQNENSSKNEEQQTIKKRTCKEKVQ